MPLLNKVPGGSGKANGTEERFTVMGETIKSGDFVELYDDITVGDMLLVGFGESLQVNENQRLTIKAVDSRLLLYLFEIDKSSLTVSQKTVLSIPIAQYGSIVASCFVSENLILVLISKTDSGTWGYLFNISGGQITQIGSSTRLIQYPNSFSKATIHKIRDNLSLITGRQNNNICVAMLVSTENQTVTIISILDVTTLNRVRLDYSSNIICYAPGEFFWLRSQYYSGLHDPPIETYAHKLFCSENEITTTPPVLVDNTHNSYNIDTSNVFLTEWNEVIYKACCKPSKYIKSVNIHIARVPIDNPENASFTLIAEGVDTIDTRATEELLQIGKNLYSAFDEKYVFAIKREEIKAGPNTNFPLRRPYTTNAIPTIPKSGTIIIPVWNYNESTNTSYKRNWKLAVASVGPSLQLIVERFVDYTTSPVTAPTGIYLLSDDLSIMPSYAPHLNGTDKGGSCYMMLKHITYVRKSTGKIDGIALSGGTDGETIKISRCIGGG